MSFPQVNYIAYSTCSVNVEEDEAVVAKALEEGNAKLEGGECWRLVAPVSLEGWKRRGMEVEGLTKEQARCLCRSDPFNGDQTNGFFVSYFERVKVGEQGGRKGGEIGAGGVGKGIEEYEIDEETVKVYKEGMFAVEAKEMRGKKGKGKGKRGGAGAGAKVTSSTSVSSTTTAASARAPKKRKEPHSPIPQDTSNIPKKKLKKMLYKQKMREQAMERKAKKGN